MFILFFIICVALIGYGIIHMKDEEFFIPVTILTVVVVIAFLFTLHGFINGRTLDNKIAMYTEENQKIEETIGTLVKEYMNYESNTYIEVKNESLMSLVSLFPELKTDELVKKQIDIHINNNLTIKRLKEQKINISKCKFWLYFGG
jgi:hypothetical protein